MQFDPARGEVRYRCVCGRLVSVSVSALVPDSTDYCSCGDGTKISVSEKDLAEFRKLAGLPQTPEG